MGVNLRENTAVDALTSTNIKITSPMATGVNNGSKINNENGEEHYHHEEDKVNRKVSWKLVETVVPTPTKVHTYLLIISVPKTF